MDDEDAAAGDDGSEGPCLFSFPGASWRRSVKRKVEEAEAVVVGVARVEAEEEAAALREAVAAAQDTVAALRVEVDEERAAAASAASEAMAMMLRLQREKAEVQMELRQFRRFAEERMAVDADELTQLDILLARRDAALESLRGRIRSYRLHFQRLGLPLPDDDQHLDDDLDDDGDQYPLLRCSDEDYHENDYHDGAADAEDVPSQPAPLMDLERRIYRLEHEESPADTGSVGENACAERDASPVGSVQERSNLYEGHDEEPEDKFSESPVASMSPGDGEEDGGDSGSGSGSGGSSYRVYTIDTVHGMAAPTVRVSEQEGWEGRKEAEPDIKKLYMRLEALEADRESMRQALLAMRTEKAQLVLLREIAQQLAKDAAPAPPPVTAPAVRHLPVKPVVVDRRFQERKNRALVRTFSIGAFFKWVIALIFWRKHRPPQSRYKFGVSINNAGLLLLLDKYPRIQRSLSKKC